MKRSQAREYLMQLIFQMEAQKDYSGDNLELFYEDHTIENNQLQYFEGMLSCWLNNRQEADRLIEDNSRGWRIGRIAKTDLAILRLAITELCFSAELPEELKVPEGVAISEAVRIAKLYGTEDSGRFVNGILGKISRDKRPEGEL